MKFEADPSGRVICPFDHHSSEFADRFSEIIDELRERTPLAWSDQHGGFWVATSFDLVRKLAMDTANFQIAQGEDRRGGLQIPARPHEPGTRPRPLFVPGEADGEEHDRYRLALNPMFSKQKAIELQPTIERHVRGTIDRLIDRGEFDAIHDFAGPILAGIAFEHLGLEAEDPYEFSNDMHHIILHGEDDDGGDAVARFNRAWAKVAEVVAARRRDPKDGVITHLTQWQEPVFSDEEVQMMAWNVVLGAGHTTTTLISQALLYMDEHRDVRDMLARDPSLMAPAIDEFLRLISPAMGNGRTAMRDITVGDVTVRKGDRVLISIWGANHDPARYPDPQTFDLERGARQHMGMYVGEHFCLGAWLAKSIARHTLLEVLRRMPDYHVDKDRAVPATDRSALNMWLSMPVMTR